MDERGGSDSTPTPAQTARKVVISLENCILPPSKLTVTPSQKDGLDADSEADLRIVGCEMIQTAGILLKLPQTAMATGQVLYHRFYYSKSFVRHAWERVAIACVCLASKIEEAPRRARDVINTFHHIKQIQNEKTIAPLILDNNYTNLKNQVIKAERQLLKELGFCVHVKHPHKIIVIYLQQLELYKNRELVQKAWNYMNDSLRTDVFVRYTPEVIGSACIYLAARKVKIVLPRKPAWFKVFGATEEEIQDIAIKILNLYKRGKPNVEKLEGIIQKLKRNYEDAKVKAKSSRKQTSSPDRKESAVNSRSASPASANHSDRSPERRKRSWSPDHSSKDINKKYRKDKDERYRKDKDERIRMPREHQKPLKSKKRPSESPISSSDDESRYRREKRKKAHSRKHRYRSRSRSLDRDVRKKYDKLGMRMSVVN